MKRNRLYIIPLMLLMLWGITSCENDSPAEQPAGTEAGSGITLKLSIPRPAASRAAEEPGEEVFLRRSPSVLPEYEEDSSGQRTAGAGKSGGGSGDG